jgi:hypothetical protein
MVKGGCYCVQIRALHTAGLLDRLNAREPVLIAEGYLFEFERLGYLQAGGFVPEVVLEHPDRVRLMHEDFVHAGSDVVQAFTVLSLVYVRHSQFRLVLQFYTNPGKLALIGRRPQEVEEINRRALRIARDVATRTDTLMCGDLSTTNEYSPNADDQATVRQVYKVGRTIVVFQSKLNNCSNKCYGLLKEVLTISLPRRFRHLAKRCWHWRQSNSTVTVRECVQVSLAKMQVCRRW